LTLPPAVKIFLAAGVTDMRKSFDGLTGLVRGALAQDPLSGHLFVFCNRRKDRLKILYFDGSGLWVFAKRLEKGTFAWPAADAEAAIEMRASELALLLGGIDLASTRRRRWYDRKPA
jgi:transposase